MRLLLVRHGESVGNVQQHMQGRDDPLTDRGRRQARAIAEHLATHDDIRHLYASPLARAFETSHIIGAAINMTPEIRENLAEINVGTAVGWRFSEWQERYPEEVERFHQLGVEYAFPEGESAKQLGDRVAAEIDNIIDTHRDSQDAVVVVSHGGAMAWIVAHLLDEPRDKWPEHDFDNCSLTEVEIDARTERVVTVVCHNEIGHLAEEPIEEVVTGRA